MSGLQAIRVEGGIVPPTLFQHMQADDIGDPTSRSAASYHLVGRESIRDAANRSWTYLVGAWQSWREAQAKEPAAFASTNGALVRERWLLVLIQELGYGRLAPHSGGITVDEHTYPVSHLWQQVPIHLVGPGVDLDRRHPGVTGATRAPQAMVQELLNRTDEHLWALLANGLRLRLLRDSTALAGSAFVEFDLEAIFDGELFAEFLLLWQTCHQSRLEARRAGDGDSSITECWMEVWRTDAVKSGARALDKLRVGVEDALGHLGTGFLAHPDNHDLRDALASGALSRHDYHRHLLRLVYRLLFLFVTEDRDVLHDPAATSEARARYDEYLSTRRLRAIARRRQGSGSYADLWHGQRLVLRALGGDGRPELGLPALGGLFDPEAGQGDPLLDAELPNDAFLAALRDLAWIKLGTGRLQPVDYRNLGAEELGGVYESLLELEPRVSVEEHTFAYERLSGNERKTTGSYYTPPGLVSALLDTALDPVLDDTVSAATDSADAERRLLALTVCDPACGSGHFLVAAARRIAQRLAALRSGEDEPTPADVRHALRDVVGRCIYGVDLNPLAAELAKVSLWLEAIEPGKALGFLDARIRVGNSLFGTTPALLAAGLPDGAFLALDGDEKAATTAARKRNAQERGAFGQVQDLLDLDFETGDDHALTRARTELLVPLDDADAIRAQAHRWREYEHSAQYLDRKVQADAWAAAFVWPYSAVTRTAEGGFISVPYQSPTSAIIRRLGSEPSAATLQATRALVERLAAEYRFFHWHLEFPEVFDRTIGAVSPRGWTGGFDAVLGNPPWEHIELKEQEYFASRDPEIAAAAGAKRKRLIAALENDDPSLFATYTADKRHVDGLRKYAAESDVYPLTGRGRVKTDSVFAELFRSLTSPSGRAGIIVPTGIATDATTQYFFKDLVETQSLTALFDFENRAPLFENVDSRFKFCLLTLSGRERRTTVATFAFFLRDPRDIDAARFNLTPEEITLLNPNTGTLPIFRTRRDAEITLGAYRRIQVLLKEGDPSGNPWGISFTQGLFNITSDSGFFRTREQLEQDNWRLNGNHFEKSTRDGLVRMLPLYQGIMASAYDHRAADVMHSGTALQRQNQPRYLADDEKDDPNRLAQPSSWVAAEEVARRLPASYDRGWLLTFRDITSPTNERTMIPAGVPIAAVGNKTPIVYVSEHLDPRALYVLLGSFAFDYLARQKVGGTSMNYFIVKQIAIPSPDQLREASPWLGSNVFSWIASRVSELSYTARDMSAIETADSGATAPFRWNTDRRVLICAELDAAAFHFYGMNRGDVEYILDTFPIVRRKDIEAHGEYRTKRLILEVFDAMRKAIETGTSYKTILDPPPGHGPRHPASTPATPSREGHP